MPIVEKTQSLEEINQGNQAGEATRQRLAEQIKGSNVFKTLDIPTETEEQAEPEVTEEGTEETEVPEESQEENIEESNETPVEENQEEEFEDMVPKSKIQPRLDDLVAKNKLLESKIRNLENAKSTENKPVDDTTDKLQKMSTEELKVLKRQVRVAQLEAKDDKTKLNDLLDLEDKIDETVQTAPVRFAQAQVAAYNKMADKLAAEYDIKEVEKAAPSIVKMAKEIYQRYPKLQSDVEGQAIALEIAADKYKELSKYSLTKGSVNNLKSQVNKLKQKTSLDNRSSKSAGEAPIVDRLRAQASGGTTRDKLALVKGDPRFNVDNMIPSEYK